MGGQSSPRFYNGFTVVTVVQTWVSTNLGTLYHYNTGECRHQHGGAKVDTANEIDQD